MHFAHYVMGKMRCGGLPRIKIYSIYSSISKCPKLYSQLLSYKRRNSLLIARYLSIISIVSDGRLMNMFRDQKNNNKLSTAALDGNANTCSIYAPY